MLHVEVTVEQLQFLRKPHIHKATFGENQAASAAVIWARH